MLGMQPAVFSSLNNSVYSGVRRVITGQQAAFGNSVGEFFFGDSGKYSAQIFPGTSKFCLSGQSKRKLMATCGSGLVVGDAYRNKVFRSGGTYVDLRRPSTAFFNDRGQNSCGIARSMLKTQGNVRLGCLGDALPRSNLQLKLWMKNSHSVSSICYAARAAHSASFDGEPFASKTISDRTIVGDKTFKLLSGSCYLPHPAKEKTGGEDAHFICADQQAVGVADGVGGWAEVGINAGDYARELMSNSVAAIQQEPGDSIDPARVLEKAHSSTKAQGSSTACIITFTDGNIHAINLGDSGFIVVRNGCTIFKSPAQQRGFNFTYQLMSGSQGDLPSSGQVFTIPVVPGDIIVAGTDGLFDNLFKDEVTSAVSQAVKEGFSPEATAEKLAALAQQHALDRKRQTPFASAAQQAGYQYIGGKLDDITVVVSYITE